jgi:hypothetical protein
MGPIKTANWRARRVIENLKGIIELCLPSDTFETERVRWTDVVTCFQLTIQALHQKEDFIASDIDDFQLVADDFF